jgi:hypothetical protein
MATSICACCNGYCTDVPAAIDIAHMASMGRNCPMYQKLLYLANELVIDSTRESNAKKGTGCMSEDPWKVMVSKPRRDKLGI